MITTGQSALSAVHAAVYAVLHGDVTLGALAPGGVWDSVPEDPTWPYVRVGGFEELPDDTSGRQGRKVQFSVHVWSRYRGAKEAYAICDRVVALLRYTALTCAGWEHADTVHQRTILDEPMDVGGVAVQHAEVECEARVAENIS